MTSQTKNSVMAILKETTEGTPISPSLAADYVRLQDGFSAEPSFATLENAELTGSIGMAKKIKGIEEPSMSFSHYLRHSSSEGVQPDYSDLLENALGSVDVRSTERDTIAASTVSLVKLDVGEGAEFERGDALLVKHSANDYEIRNVLSVSSDDLTLAQDLNNAPPVSTALGKNILYKPVNTGHPTHTFWLFMGNATAGAVQMMSGGRVTSVSIECNAGEFINASYSAEGIEFYFNPIEITSSTNKMDFDDDGITEQNVSVSAKMYKDPYELAEALQTAMDAATGDSITVSFIDSGANAGKFSIASDGAQLNLLFSSGANTAQSIASKIGFDVADETGALEYFSDSVISKASPQTPSFDSADPLVAKNNEVLIGNSSSQITCFEASSVTVNVENTKADILSVCSASGKSGSVISERSISVEISALLEDHQAEEFKDFRKNNQIIFTYNGGTKSGNNWEPGKCINMHSPTMTIDEFSLDDADGLVQLNMTLSSYVDNGLNEFFINLL
jgi:hypothetical protein